jgi:integrase
MSYVLTCRTDRTDKNNLSDIQFLIHYEKRQYRLSTGEKCKPNSWDKVHHQVTTKSKDASVVNRRLQRHSWALNSIFDAQPNFDIAHIKKRFKDYLRDPDGFDPKAPTIEKTLDLNGLIDRITAKNRNQWSYGHLKKFTSLKTKILLFDPDFELSKISSSWIQNYIDFCRGRNNSHNTIHTDLKIFTKLIAEMAKHGVVVDEDCIPRNFSYIEPRVEALTRQEVERIASVDLKGLRSTLEDSRYLWLLGAYTGLRWSDLIRLTPGSFSLDRGRDDDGTESAIWHYHGLIQKTKKRFSFPLIDEAVAHLQKRDFVLPKATMQVVNRDIKEIGKLAKIDEPMIKQKVIDKLVTDISVPKYKTIHMHTSRHSYAWEIVNRSKSMPFADVFLSRMLGHASHATTWKYLNLGDSSIDKMYLAMKRKLAQ